MRDIHKAVNKWLLVFMCWIVFMSLITVTKLSPDQTWRKLLGDLFLTRPWTWALSLAHSIWAKKKKKAFRVSLVKILPTLDTLLKFPIPHSSQLITLACLQQDSCWIRLAKIHLALMFTFSNFLSTDSQSCSLVINPHLSSFYSDLSSVSFPFLKKSLPYHI